FDTSQDSVMVAHDVARQRPATLLAEDDLETAVKAYATSGQVNLPVVEDHESRRLIGVAHEHDVVLAYHRALDQARAEERGEV
ncbi:MAG: CBS domain-containing protein, partial [Alphaproteobacteria bacterium]|nr:CBS domain-containing protein [Alphaproteobacteria bacterium]